MPGQMNLHAHLYSAGQGGSIGEGGAARVLHPAGPRGGPSNLMFILWLILLGVIVPAAILGGLRAGKFQFVFTSAR